MSCLNATFSQMVLYNSENTHVKSMVKNRAKYKNWECREHDKNGERLEMHWACPSVPFN